MPISTRSDPGSAPSASPDAEWKEPRAESAPAQPGVPFGALRCLIVEDHDFQRRTLVLMLKRLGIGQVHAATDGRTALRVAEQLDTPLDIVITDLNMPGVDGMEFIRRLGEAGSSASLIIVSSLERSLIDSIQTMATAYGMKLLGAIEKPATPKKLAALIKSHNYAPVRADRPRTPNKVFSLNEITAGLKNAEFEPFFQPKIELATRQVKGAEALARWHHPQQGIITPDAFIKPLEDSGLIDELTWIILRKAAAFCSSWRATGLDVTVSVNLSLKSLTDVKLADNITRLVRSQNLDPRNVILELTESAATTEVGSTLENLSRLRMKGFGLSIDDYGTGFSSMQQLTRIAFTELKIDQSFVKNAAKQEASRVILKSSLDMARKLKIAAVAEGVELPQDLDLLRELGCDYVQGYFFAKPMDAATFLDWAREWSKTHPA
jgi:EAL domain-containing protein (putative c-di-GMP-specific phosphodiesterase class I)/FixJ family two-component response regulator